MIMSGLMKNGNPIKATTDIPVVIGIVRRIVVHNGNRDIGDIRAREIYGFVAVGDEEEGEIEISYPCYLIK
jgi:hypothetical protein